MSTLRLASPEALAEFCRRWGINELALFGSALRPDFEQDSDIDLLVTFAPQVQPSLFEHVRMQMELSELLGRRVDLVSRRAVERSSNQIRRAAILNAARIVYASR